MFVFWLICFVVLFAATEFYRWLIHLIGIDMTGFDFAELPLPVYILAGVALAIASNYSRQTGLPFQNSAPPTTPTTASTSEPSAQSTSTSPNSQPRSLTTTSAPKVHIQSATTQPQNNASTISYTIDKDNHRSERRPKSP